jgi:hypothetical protein
VASILHDQAFESREGSIQLRSCPSVAPKGKKNRPVGMGGIPVGAAIGAASHIAFGVGRGMLVTLKPIRDTLSVDINKFSLTGVSYHPFG